ncbi:MAG: hypothetical protein CVT59_04560 [Actinobacteria bacterium HGW-Actinobacteria-1]|jgi:FdhE protein|nr:MAG: hypothetical protein CVT59_04560 [Actinobacteria bacterium HGW-Actinobacteria-1]
MDLVSQAAAAYLDTVAGSDAVRLRFLEGLWDIQSAIESVDRPYSAPDRGAAREALLSGQTLFGVSAPVVPVADYTKAVAQIARYASEMAGLPAEQAEALRDTDFAAVLNENRLTGAVRSVDALIADVVAELDAKQSGPLTPASVAFVLVSALVPFLTGPADAALKALGEFDRSMWAEGRCPVCGAAASMGRMGESTTLKGAERVLWCDHCHSEWGYDRIRCTRCGTRNPDKLHYSHLEGDPAHRLHLCDECHGYTRFVFVDDLSAPLSMVVEDAISARLDAIAIENGFTANGDGGQGKC